MGLLELVSGAGSTKALLRPYLKNLVGRFLSKWGTNTLSTGLSSKALGLTPKAYSKVRKFVGVDDVKLEDTIHQVVTKRGGNAASAR